MDNRNYSNSDQKEIQAKQWPGQTNHQNESDNRLLSIWVANVNKTNARKVTAFKREDCKYWLRQKQTRKKYTHRERNVLALQCLGQRLSIFVSSASKINGPFNSSLVSNDSIWTVPQSHYRTVGR